jgi:hypothetical protein
LHHHGRVIDTIQGLNITELEFYILERNCTIEDFYQKAVGGNYASVESSNQKIRQEN